MFLQHNSMLRVFSTTSQKPCWLFTLALLSGTAFPSAAQTSSISSLNSTNCATGNDASVCSNRDATTQQITIPGSEGSRQYTPQANGQLYVDTAGVSTDKSSADLQRNTPFPPDAPTDMQKLAAASTGETLPIFGRDLFQNAPSTFAPADQIPVLSDYVVGPGDVLLVRLWGPLSFNGQLTVDSAGSIYIPQAGSVHVAGFTADQLQTQISAVLRHTFRNFNLSVNLGHLRSIQVYVVGEARRPGAYTVSSLSTLLNVLFVAGGPNTRGSMRQIEVRREGKVICTFDLYDLLLKGDKTKDLRLQTNDTIFIPSAGALAALGGSVRHPAIYELKGETKLGELIDLAGGFTEVGSSAQISLERIQNNQTRAAMTVKLDEAGRDTRLRDGDVLFANHISAAFQQSVTVRGNLANPGRFPWHMGMRLSDVIPDRASLLTNDYWKERNRLGVPVPLFLPDNNSLHAAATQALRAQNTDADTSLAARNSTQGASSGLRNTATLASELPGSTQGMNALAMSGISARSAASSVSASSTGTRTDDDDERISRGSFADQQILSRRSVSSVEKRNTISIPAPEINWSYAVIERLDSNTLKNSLIPFNLGKLVLQHDASQDLELQPGDIVTILSQDDIHGPQEEQTKYVRLEGEFAAAGVYSVKSDETLDELIRRAGGLTPKAYLYGASFTRESARVFQQQRLDEYIAELAVNLQRDAAVRSASTTGNNPSSSEQNIISQLHKLRATGRIVLDFKPDSSLPKNIPHIALEDGDVFRIPSQPQTVAVIGSVYGQNVFLYNSRYSVRDYLKLAGNAKPTADIKHAFIIRADGAIFSRDRAQGAWHNNFDTTYLNPGDSIVIPEKPIRPTALRQVIEYSQMFSQFALGAAAITVLE